MTVLADFKRKVLRVLQEQEEEDSDPVAGVTSPPELLTEAVNAALTRISARVWKPSVLQIEEAGTEFTLPSDLVNIEAVYDKTLKKFVPRLALQSTGTIDVTGGNAWLQYPNGYITFMNELEDAGATVYYAAHWLHLDNDDDVSEAPKISETAITLYAAAYCMLAEAAGSADIRQFNQRVDSGKPTDIPAKDMAVFLMKFFEAELQSLPMTTRAIR